MNFKIYLSIPLFFLLSSFGLLIFPLPNCFFLLPYHSSIFWTLPSPVSLHLETNTTSAPSSLSGSTATAGTCETFQGLVIPTCVYLHSNTAIVMEIEDTPSATSDLICQAIVNCDELGLNKQLASQVFALWMHSSLLGITFEVSWETPLFLFRITAQTHPQTLRGEKSVEVVNRSV